MGHKERVELIKRQLDSFSNSPASDMAAFARRSFASPEDFAVLAEALLGKHGETASESATAIFGMRVPGIGHAIPVLEKGYESGRDRAAFGLSNAYFERREWEKLDRLARIDDPDTVGAIIDSEVFANFGYPPGRVWNSLFRHYERPGEETVLPPKVRKRLARSYYDEFVAWVGGKGGRDAALRAFDDPNPMVRSAVPLAFSLPSEYSRRSRSECIEPDGPMLRRIEEMLSDDFSLASWAASSVLAERAIAGGDEGTLMRMCLNKRNIARYEALSSMRAFANPSPSLPRSWPGIVERLMPIIERAMDDTNDSVRRIAHVCFDKLSQSLSGRLD